jgi:hypothetical protein
MACNSMVAATITSIHQYHIYDTDRISSFLTQYSHPLLPENVIINIIALIFCFS